MLAILISKMLSIVFVSEMLKNITLRSAGNYFQNDGNFNFSHMVVNYHVISNDRQLVLRNLHAVFSFVVYPCVAKWCLLVVCLWERGRGAARDTDA